MPIWKDMGMSRLGYDLTVIPFNSFFHCLLKILITVTYFNSSDMSRNVLTK